MDIFCKIFLIWQRVTPDLWELGYWTDYFNCGKIVIKCTTLVRGDVLNQIGWNQMEKEEFSIASSYFKEALNLFKRIDYWQGECESLRYLGVLNHRQKYFGSTIKFYRQALNLIKSKKNINEADQVKQTFELAEIHNLLGNLYFKLYDFSASFNELTISLDKYSSLGEEYIYYKPVPLLNLGRWYFLQGNYAEARRYYKECLRLSEQINRTDIKVGVLIRLAELASAKGEKKKAMRLTKRMSMIISKEEFTVHRKNTKQSQQKIERVKNIFIYKNIDVVLLLKKGLNLVYYDPLIFIRFILFYFKKCQVFFRKIVNAKK